MQCQLCKLIFTIAQWINKPFFFSNGKIDLTNLGTSIKNNRKSLAFETRSDRIAGAEIFIFKRKVNSLKKIKSVMHCEQHEHCFSSCTNELDIHYNLHLRSFMFYTLDKLKPKTKKQIFLLLTFRLCCTL